jgi:hypothetical protein
VPMVDANSPLPSTPLHHGQRVLDLGQVEAVSA